MIIMENENGDIIELLHEVQVSAFERYGFVRIVVEKQLENYTIAELTKMCEEKGIEIPKKSNKTSIIELLK